MIKETSKRIKQRREELGITQEELGFAINSDQQQIWRYESGKGKPSAEKLIALAKALNTTIDYLLGESEQPEKSIINNDLTESEMKLISSYRKKSPEAQKKIIDIIEIV